MVHTFFFFKDTATTEIFPLSLHDALPISARATTRRRSCPGRSSARPRAEERSTRPPPERLVGTTGRRRATTRRHRSEEHTSELQSQSNLVCRLLLEKSNIKESVITISLDA